MLQPPLSSPLMISQPPYSYSSPQHPQEPRGMDIVDEYFSSSVLVSSICTWFHVPTVLVSKFENFITHLFDSLGMGLQIMQDIAQSHMGSTPPRSPSQNSVNIQHHSSRLLAISSPLNPYAVKLFFHLMYLCM